MCSEEYIADFIRLRWFLLLCGKKQFKMGFFSINKT